MYPRARLNALTDGLFGVAMTLLVLEVRLPDDFNPRDAHELLAGLAGLWPKFFPYLISFFVLGSRWLASAQVRTAASEEVSARYAVWWLLYLFLITLDPITTSVAGRFPHHAPAIWLYAGDTALIAAVSWRMMSFVPDDEWTEPLRVRRINLSVMLLSSLATIVISFFSSNVAPWAMGVNVIVPLIGVRPHARAAESHT